MTSGRSMSMHFEKRCFVCTEQLITYLEYLIRSCQSISCIFWHVTNNMTGKHRHNLETDLGVNNSYSIDLFEQRAAQIIQVNNQKVKLKEIRFQELHKNFGTYWFITQENRDNPFLIYLASQVYMNNQIINILKKNNNSNAWSVVNKIFPWCVTVTSIGYWNMVEFDHDWWGCFWWQSQAPHSPLEAPQRFVDLYPDVSDPAR